MAENEKITQLIHSYKAAIDNLENAQNGTHEEQNNAIKDALSFNSYCCGSCIAVSNVCTPDKTPNKCQGGCTAVSFVL
ncbi:MAG: hypothetical protein HDT40_06070 [Lachnospiraceae bacterium]|nr:hypothetical protein [Lachnospiraceae bacterium]